MENQQHELDELERILAELRPPELSRSRAEDMRRASMAAFATGQRWNLYKGHGMKLSLAGLAEAAAICSLVGFYLAWAVLRTASLLGAV